LNLSKRLERLTDFVSEGNILADIGTDHAFVPIYLVSENKVPTAIAMDINEGPLEKANRNIRSKSLENKIKIRLSNGLDKLEAYEADTILIAGMGGELIVDILKRGDNLKYTTKEYILSPHSEWFKLRKFLRENSYKIIKEDMLIDEGKYYIIIKAVFEKSELNLSEKDEYLKYDIYGEYLIKAKHPILRQFLNEELNTKIDILNSLKDIKGEKALERKKELEDQVRLIEEVLYEMQ
jgi:hypothetical protein